MEVKKVEFQIIGKVVKKVKRLWPYLIRQARGGPMLRARIAGYAVVSHLKIKRVYALRID